jgi:phosphoesterase RecJ-like protein
MADTRDFLSLNSWLEQCRMPLVITHRRPDGDALGAQVAMALALRRRGLQPQVVLFEPFPPRYALLASAVKWCLWEETRDVLGTECDAVVILDTCSVSQLEPIAEYLGRAPRTLVIDHHATRDAIGTRDGDLRVFDETAAATCLIITEWVRASGLIIDEQMATALFVGLATDTGWFRFSNTDVRALRAATELMEVGANPNKIHWAIYQQEPPAKLRLIARMLESLELHVEGKLAIMTLRPADFEAVGADHTMTEDLVQEATRLGCVEAVVLFTEGPDGEIRVNFRSKQRLDVSSLATRFGGGGHARAAGARLRGQWDYVVPRVIAEVVAAVQAAVSE